MSKRSLSNASSSRVTKLLKSVNNIKKDDDDICEESSSEIFSQGILDCRSEMKLKSDHVNRPLWIISNGHIFLESFSIFYKEAQDFLISIAEPISRPEYIHEYQLTPYSLYAAVSMDIQTKEIIEYLERFSKTSLPQNIIQFIESSTSTYGKMKLVLKHNRYFIESQYPDILKNLLQDSQIRECRLISTELNNIDVKTTEIFISADKQKSDDVRYLYKKFDEDEDEDDWEDLKVVSFEIVQNKIEVFRKRCQELNYPLLEEYDFHHDTNLKKLNIELRPNTILRPYQEKCLQKIFSNGRARSGLVVLPCGAGKTLVGITVSCTINKSCLILCNSNVSVQQWKQQFQMWSTANDKNIRLFTAENKQKPTDDCIYISTYPMMIRTEQSNNETMEIMKLIKDQEWGLMIIDEVHTIVADEFRKVLSMIHVHIKLGLTATLVREDERIDDLNFLIGPKLYEANWMELQNQGYIAHVLCGEVRCQMTQEFFQAYISTNKDINRCIRLSTMNPNKFRICQYLIEYHEKRMDKILVFCDDIYSLRSYAKILQKPFIDGKTSENERMTILNNFQHNSNINTIFVSKIADTSFDLPNANVLIEISSHGGSRRQEAQRLGRILRAKKGTRIGEVNAFFYALVSQDTREMYYSSKRQSFLNDQGYSYKIITQLPIDKEDGVNLFFSTQKEQKKLLQQVLLRTNSDSYHHDHREEQTTKEVIRRRTTNQKSHLNKTKHPLFRKYRS